MMVGNIISSKFVSIVILIIAAVLRASRGSAFLMRIIYSAQTD